uniref:Uncharacterized protein n=1 Tax=Glossina palpalis gambiensis TaxID=67801 RepID=A0A1B0BME1_9MUSC
MDAKAPSSMHKKYQSIDYCANVSCTVIVAALAIATFNGLASLYIEDSCKTHTYMHRRMYLFKKDINNAQGLTV